MELYQALLVDRKHEVIAFFDDSKEFKGRSINKIRVIVDFEELREEVRKEPNLQILLSIPSISMHLRRKIISKEMIKRGLVPKTTKWQDDIKKQIDLFKPDLIGLSCTEDMWELGVRLLNEKNITLKKIKHPL